MYAPLRQQKKYIFLMYAPLRNEKMYSQSCERKEERTFFN